MCCFCRVTPSLSFWVTGGHSRLAVGRVRTTRGSLKRLNPASRSPRPSPRVPGPGTGTSSQSEQCALKDHSAQEIYIS